MRFGVEIECLVPVTLGTTYEDAVHVVEEKIRNAGVSVRNVGYTHQRSTYWKIVYDRSVTRAGYYGIELVSPPMLTEIDSSFGDIETVCKSLIDIGGRINRSCGLHVHVDASNMTIGVVKMVFKRYSKFEEEIDKFFPQSRRGSNNSYCMPINRYNPNASRINDILYERYSKINVQSFTRHGTVEFRQHHGTLNHIKIKNWVMFIQEFIDNCRKYVGQSIMVKKYPPVMERYGLKNRRVLNQLKSLYDGANRDHQPVISYMLAKGVTMERITLFRNILSFMLRERVYLSNSAFMRGETAIENPSIANDISWYIRRDLKYMRPHNEMQDSNASVTLSDADDIFDGISENVTKFYKKRLAS